MTDVVCRRCGWLTFAFERRCHICGFDRWNRTHNGSAGDWSKGLIFAA